MAKSPEQILMNHRLHAERSKNGLDVAKAGSNAELATQNICEIFKSFLMQALINWRCRLDSPVVPLREAITNLRQGNSILAAMGVHGAEDLPCERATIIEFLVNEDSGPCDSTPLFADRLLDATLGRGLHGGFDNETWTVALEQLRQLKGSSLAVESYMTYHRLLLSAGNSDVRADVKKADSLFDKRKGNTFYGGAEQTEGGGNDNAITVDYRLAAIMKKIGYKGDSVHAWRWD
jgi:hypothetical protein